MFGRTAMFAVAALGLASCAPPEGPQPYLVSTYPGGDVIIGMPEGASPIIADRKALFYCFGGSQKTVVLYRVQDDRRIYRCIDEGKDTDFERM